MSLLDQCRILIAASRADAGACSLHSVRAGVGDAVPVRHPAAQRAGYPDPHLRVRLRHRADRGAVHVTPAADAAGSGRDGGSGLDRSVRARRRSWLLGFTSAVVARVRAAEQRAAAQADDDREDDGPGTELVLADRAKIVQHRIDNAYPQTRKTRMTYSGSGYGAGYAQGQQADLAMHDSRPSPAGPWAVAAGRSAGGPGSPEDPRRIRGAGSAGEAHAPGAARCVPGGGARGVFRLVQPRRRGRERNRPFAALTPRGQDLFPGRGQPSRLRRPSPFFGPLKNILPARGRPVALPPYYACVPSGSGQPNDHTPRSARAAAARSEPLVGLLEGGKRGCAIARP